MMKCYGISNCDTVKKARKQLDEQNTEYEFIDLKTTTLSEILLTDWLTQCPDTLVNKRSTTYRNIKAEWLAAKTQAEKISLIQSNPTLIKRPVLAKENGDIIVGFDTTAYQLLT